MTWKKIILGVLSFSVLIALVVLGFYSIKKDPVVLKFGHNMPEGTPHHDGALKFKELVELATNGAIEIHIHPNQTLGTDPEMVEMLQRGDLAFSIPPTSKISSLASNLKVLDIPYLFTDRESLYRGLDGAFGDFLYEQLRETGLEPVVMWESGYKNFTANKPIRSPNDFSGLRFRVMISDTLVDQAIALNAFPANVDFHLVREKLAMGEIDCQENPISSIFAMKIYEEQTHIMESRHGYLGQLFLASKKILDKLSHTNQQIILDAAKKAAVYQRSRIPSYEDRFLEKMKESGVQVVIFSEDIKKQFVEHFAPIYYENRQLLAPFTGSLNPLIAPYLQEHVAIGLNLSFSHPASASALAIKRGVELAIDEINASGGLLGRPVILLTKTHDGFPRNGINNLLSFAEDKSVIAVVGGMHSPVVLAERDTINRIKLPYLIPWAAATPIIHENNPYIFRFSVRDADAGAKLLEKAAMLGTNITLLLENTGWGKSNEKSVRDAMRTNGEVKLGDIHWFEWGKKDFSEVIDKMYASNDEVIIFVGNSPEGVHFVRSLAQRKKMIPIVSHWGITGGRFWDEVKDIIPRLNLSFLTTFDGSKNGQASEFLLKYTEKYNISPGGYIPAAFGSIHSYELVKILADSVIRVKSLATEDIVKSLNQLDHYEGLFKSYANIFARPGREREALGPEDISFGRYDSQGNIRNDVRK